MKTLRKGSKGAEVLTLQKLLNKLGYTVVEDSDFGQKTENAVKALQKDKGLVSDGIVGEKTWAALGVTDAKCVDPSVLYLPITAHITKSPNRPIKYLAIHYTAGRSSVAGCVKAVRNVFQNGRASADFAVDDRDMAQYNPDIKNYYCWAVGNKKAAKVNVPDGCNKNTISIEICSSLRENTDYRTPNHEGWYFTPAALDNAVKLTKLLMKKYGIPIERVVRHYDISGKLCPGVVNWTPARLRSVDGKLTNKFGNESEWLKFKKRLV